MNVRAGVRRLAKAPVFAIVALTALAVGIGANITIFGFVNAIVLRALDVPEPERLVRMDSGEGIMASLPESDCEAYRERQQSFDGLAMFIGGGPAPVRIDDATEMISVTPVSGNYCFKLAARRGFGWLDRFRGLGKRALGGF